MISNKKIALTLAILSILYTISSISLFFYTGESIILNLSKPVIKFDNTAVVIICDVLDILLFVGILWVTVIFKEKTWLSIGIGLYIIVKIVFSTALFNPKFRSIFLELNENFLYLVTLYISALLYLLVSAFAVKSPVVKKYFRWIAILFAITTFLPALSGYLYDNFLQANWLLINKDVFSITIYAVMSALFIKLYFFSRNDVSALTTDLSQVSV